MNILMVGNSFSICVGSYMPQCVATVPGCELELTSAYIGGCSLQRHWNNILEAEENPEAAQYLVSDWGYADGDGPLQKLGKEYNNVIALLKSRKWDVVTIQQASHESWDYANYQPYAENLIAKIKELCPGAEIVIQQTWAYNAADRRLNKESEWGFEQAEMHKRARASYKKLQEATGFRVIPTGDAVAIARAKSNGSAELEPVNPGPDTIHLCKKGEYLQACVWFGFMYGKNPEEITYVPEELTEEEAKFYRTCAKEALTNGFW